VGSHLFHYTAGLLIIATLLGATPQATAEDGTKELTYQDRLVFGLQARRPSEKEFIEAVVDTVNRGELPRKLVDRTFFWARERTSQKEGRKARRPIIYFQPALTMQAEKLEIRIRKN
jgi:hypothetical protein